MGRYAEGSRKGVGGYNKGPATKVYRLPLEVGNFAKRLASGSLRGGDIAGFLDLNPNTCATVPLVSSVAACGFPSPADDYLDRALDFNELLIEHPAATFAVRISGESMTGAGLYPGDIAVVDRSLTPTNDCIVLALIEGEFTIKRYLVRAGTVVLKAENPAFADIAINPETGFEVWGVIRRSIRML